MSMGIRRAQRAGEAVLYGGLPAAGLVNSAVKWGQQEKCHMCHSCLSRPEHFGEVANDPAISPCHCNNVGIVHDFA